MAAPHPASPSLRHVTVASHHCISQSASLPSGGRPLVGGAPAERRLTQPIGGRRPALRVLRRPGRVCAAWGGGARRGRPGSGGGRRARARGRAGQRRGGRGKHQSPEPGSGGLLGLSQGKRCLKAARGCWGWAGIVGVMKAVRSESLALPPSPRTAAALPRSVLPASEPQPRDGVRADGEPDPAAIH